MLRDEQIDKFESNKDFKVEDLVNIECLYISHNFLSDLDGVSMLNTLIELNLNYNKIVDVTPLEELHLLERLYLSNNKITVIDPLRKL